MYLVPLKTAIVEAFRAVYDVDYPVEELRDINISIEFPIAQADYPCYWVNYDDTAELTVAGIGHEELRVDGDGYQRYTRWRFAGTISVTAVALSSRERDQLYDELVRVFAFGRYTEPTNQFRQKIEENDLVAMQINFDDLRPSGDNAAMGTPWETSEMVYEKSLSMDVIGEFIGDPITQSIVPLGEVRVLPYVEGLQPPPSPPLDPDHVTTGWI